MLILFFLLLNEFLETFLVEDNEKNNYLMNKNILKFYFCVFLLGTCLSSLADEGNPTSKCEKILIKPSSPLSHRFLWKLLTTTDTPWTSVPILMQKVPALKTLSLDTAKRIYAEFYRDTYDKEFDFETQHRILLDLTDRLMLNLIEEGISWSNIRSMVEKKYMALENYP